MMVDFDPFAGKVVVLLAVILVLKFGFMEIHTYMHTYIL